MCVCVRFQSFEEPDDITVMTSQRPADVVTDEAEACGARLLLHGSPESSLSWSCHGVCFIQDDDLERRTGLPTDKEKKRRARKRMSRCKPKKKEEEKMKEQSIGLMNSLWSTSCHCQLSKVLHLLSDHLDTSFIRSVEFQHPLSEELRTAATPQFRKKPEERSSPSPSSSPPSSLTHKVLWQLPEWWRSFLSQEVHRTGG